MSLVSKGSGRLVSTGLDCQDVQYTGLKSVSVYVLYIYIHIYLHIYIYIYTTVQKFGVIQTILCLP